MNPKFWCLAILTVAVQLMQTLLAFFSLFVLHRPQTLVPNLAALAAILDGR